MPPTGRTCDRPPRVEWLAPFPGSTSEELAAVDDVEVEARRDGEAGLVEHAVFAMINSHSATDSGGSERHDQAE